MAPLSGVAGYQHARGRNAASGWHEIAWPFPRDGWPAGRAFRCDTATCGDEVELYVRPKIGFCNCDTGVADDDEVDRVADLDLMSERFAPLAPGDVIEVPTCAAARAATISRWQDGSRHTAVGIAVSQRCDLLVAVAQGHGTASNVQRAALDFLRSSNMARWMTAAIDGG